MEVEGCSGAGGEGDAPRLTAVSGQLISAPLPRKGQVSVKRVRSPECVDARTRVPVRRRAVDRAYGLAATALIGRRRYRSLRRSCVTGGEMQTCQRRSKCMIKLYYDGL